MSIQTHFNKFNKNIYLISHSEGYKKAKAKDESILKEIKSAFKEAGYPARQDHLDITFCTKTNHM